MKKNSHSFTRLLVSVAFCSVAMGAQAQGSLSTAMAPGNSYVELGIGQSDYSLGSGSGLFGFDKDTTAYSVRGGGFFNSNMGAEVGYTSFGSIDRAGGTTKAQGINLSLLGRLPLGASFNLLGKIGTTYSQTDVSSRPASGIVAGSKNGFGLAYGVGAEYVFSPQLSGVLQYESHDLKFAGDRKDRVGVTSLSARYRF